MRRWMAALVAAFALVIFTGCGDDDSNHKEGTHEKKDGDKHEHKHGDGHDHDH